MVKPRAGHTRAARADQEAISRHKPDRATSHLKEHQATGPLKAQAISHPRPDRAISHLKAHQRATSRLRAVRRIPGKPMFQMTYNVCANVPRAMLSPYEDEGTEA